ncbi:TraR/DksA C4-type zinc finger protein [Fuchsiella alkaliacetigena]|uniref:TraR/DksA C4-type zinc finger protein n=1 Tax=Fuchsiella alkaliacetigena TaxID=957042 RepID=UPI00200ADFF8|nr:TraR/DksA C4-type zinc finger protein [Fuchsiella alkaliacetigena]MCK8825330.1 TraR/DksA C4-type zinc finger protein [Fuchsiella alkaliacetigena]
MKKEKQEHYKQELLIEKAGLLKQFYSLQDEEFSLNFKESTGELSSYDNHPSDQASNTFEREKDLGLQDNSLQFLKKIDYALAKLEKGDYGNCEVCGEDIREERLDSIPYTTYCFDCKKAEEGNRDEETVDRPVEEESLTPPFGRTFLDGQDSVNFDGEDAWQAVARFGTVNTPSDIPGAEEQDGAYVGTDEEQGIVGEEEKISEEEIING